MKKEECNRKNLLIKEFIKDWDELNIAFKALIFVGFILFCVVVSLAFFSSGGVGMQNSIEVVFRSTLASVFGFLLSSNIKNRSKKKNAEIEKIKNELNQARNMLENLDDTVKKEEQYCDLEEVYDYKELNMVQIVIALFLSVICILIINGLLITNNLDNVPAIAQIRDLMCSAIGFLIGESGKK